MDWLCFSRQKPCCNIDFSYVLRVFFKLNFRDIIGKIFPAGIDGDGIGDEEAFE